MAESQPAGGGTRGDQPVPMPPIGGGAGGVSTDQGGDGPTGKAGQPDAGEAGQPGACSLAPDDCSIRSDNCPGVPTCSGRVLQKKRFTTERVRVTTIATSAEGKVAIGGYYEGPMDFGGTSAALPATADHDGFVVMMDNDAKVLWSYGFGGVGAQEITGLAFVPGGGVIAQGVNDPTLLDELHVPLGDAFAASLDATGKLLWKREMVGPQIFPGQVLAERDGSVLLVGNFLIGLQYDGLRLDRDDGVRYRLRLNPQGLVVSVFQEKIPVFAAPEVPLETEIDADGNILSFVSNNEVYDAHETIDLTKRAPDGAALWTRSFDHSRYASLADVASGAHDDLLVVGAFSDALTLGDTTLQKANPTTSPAIGYDGWVASLSNTGAVQWVHQYPSRDLFGVFVSRATTDTFGNYFVAGTSGAATIEGKGFRPARTMLYLVKLRPDGRRVWVKALAENREAACAALATDAAGNLWVAGWYYGVVDLGNGQFESVSEDGFVLKVAP